MHKQDFILHLYRQPQTVFTMKDLSLLFPNKPYPYLRRQVHYYAKTGKIKRLRRGIYAKEPYNPLELANKLYIPSYISLETVLQQDGLIFQYDETIYAVSYVSRAVTVEGISIQYRKTAQDILLNTAGIEEQAGYARATKERAFLDAVYVYKNYHIDNLEPLQWEKVFSLQRIYHSKQLEKRVAEYYQSYQEEYAQPNTA